LISSSKLGWGGARPNSGGPRPNSGGPRANSGGFRPGAGAKPKPVVIWQPADGLRWYCVRTRYEDEKLAAIQIGLAGFDVFAPTVWKPAMRARRDAFGVLRPARPAHLRPLFQRYQFVRFHLSDNWQDIRELPGVDGILGTAPDRPVAMPAWAIEQIRSRCSENGCVYPSSPGQPENALVGKLVRLTEGPMTSFEGICDWSDSKRVRVLLSLFGRDCPITVDQTAVEAA